MRFSFPICRPDGSQYDNAREFFNLLQQETAGNYLIGKSNFWHGGIHISDKTAPHCVDRDMVRCMVDGTVVAYRLNRDYHQSQWMGSTLHYSTGFVLVRHEYASPFNTLRFYSLYMHVAPYVAYDKIELKNPTYKVTASRLTVRVNPDLDSDVIGYIDVGAEIEVLETRNIASGEREFLFAKAQLVSKSIRGKDGKRVSIPQNEFWLALQEKGSTSKQYAMLLPEKKLTIPVYWKRQTTIRLSEEISARCDDSGSDSSRIGRLKVGTELTYISGTEKRVSIHGDTYQLAPCQVKSGGTVNGEMLPETIWVCVESHYSTVVALDIADLDQVVACHCPVKAGDPIARLGLYESPKSLIGGKNTRHLVHLEIFSDDARLEKFLNNDSGKKDDASFLKLEKGAVLYRLSDTEDGKAFEVSNVVLEKDVVTPRAELKSVRDKQNKEWFSVQLGTAGTCVGGYVPGDTAKWVSQYDWAGLGFQTVKAADDFDGYLDKVNTPAFFKALCQKVAAAPASTNRDKIKEVLTCRENRDIWSKLVVYHPSEWKATSDDARWSVLTDLLRSSPDLLEHESERIDRSVWWDDAAKKVEGFDQGGVVWHFHPVGFLGVLIGRVMNDVRIVSGQVTFDAEGVEDKNSKYFSRMIHWPGNDMSGVTIGRGYDMGGRDKEEIYQDLVSSGVSVEKADKIMRAAGLVGKKAQEFVEKNRNDIGEISMREQIALFNRVYPAYVEAAKKNYEKWTGGYAEHTPWGKLKQPIRDILVDFVYQGFTKGPRPMEAGMKNNIDLLIKYIKNSPQMSLYEPGRHRVQYLERNK